MGEKRSVKRVNFGGIDLRGGGGFEGGGCEWLLGLCRGVGGKLEGLREGELLRLNKGGVSGDVVGVHRLFDGSVHYILSGLDSGRLTVGYVSEGGVGGGVMGVCSGTEVRGVEGIGNTLSVLSDTGVHYFLWGGVGRGYVSLGEKLPELELGFSFRREAKASKSWRGRRDMEYKYYTDLFIGFLNRVLDDAMDEGYFVSPVLVRYAYRLFDGSTTMASPVVLLNSGFVPTQFVHWGSSLPSMFGGRVQMYSDAPKGGEPFHIRYFAHSLEVTLGDGYSELSKWGDIVKGVDVYVSKPLWGVDVKGDISKVGSVNGYKAFVRVGNQMRLTTDADLKQISDGATDGFMPNRELGRRIGEESTFYLLGSYTLGELGRWRKGERRVLRPGSGWLRNIVHKEQLRDDYNSHNKVWGGSIGVYNKRLHMCDVVEEVWRGYEGLLPYGFIGDDRDVVGIRVVLRKGGRDIVVGRDVSSGAWDKRWFYYPDRDAVRLEVKYKSGVVDIVPLVGHPFLQGSYYWDYDGSGRGIERGSGLSPLSSSLDLQVRNPSGLYVSEVGNPFVFGVDGIHNVGGGRLVGVCSATAPVSEGQFGQYPLYVFGEEGIWAMGVGGDGRYVSKHPVTRDVCVGGIVSLDDGVAFVSGKGVMLLSGRSVTCLSEPLEGVLRPLFQKKAEGMDLLHDRSLYPLLERIDASFRIGGGFFASVGEWGSDSGWLGGGLSGLSLCYDYVGRRLYVGGGSLPCILAYSFISREWSSIVGRMRRGLTLYPRSVYVDGNGDVREFKRGGGSVSYGIVTRRLDVGGLHTLVGLYLRGDGVGRRSTGIVAYGSLDGSSWVLLGACNDSFIRGVMGTPYRYFKFVIRGFIGAGDSISGVELLLMKRFSNRLR